MYDYEVFIPKYMCQVDKGWDIEYSDEDFIQCLFKIVCGYSVGDTFTKFMIELKLAEELAKDGEVVVLPTEFGKKFLYFYHYTNQARFVYEDSK